MSELPEWFGRHAAKRFTVGEHWCSDGALGLRCSLPSDDSWPISAVKPEGAAIFQSWIDIIGYSVVTPVPYPGLHDVGDGSYSVTGDYIQLPHRLRDTGERLVQARYIELAAELFPGIVWWAGDRTLPLVGIADGPVAAVMGIKPYPCDAWCCQPPPPPGILRGGWGIVVEET